MISHSEMFFGSKKIRAATNPFPETQLIYSGKRDFISFSLVRNISPKSLEFSIRPSSRRDSRLAFPAAQTIGLAEWVELIEPISGKSIISRRSEERRVGEEGGSRGS